MLTLYLIGPSGPVKLAKKEPKPAEKKAAKVIHLDLIIQYSANSTIRRRRLPRRPKRLSQRLQRQRAPQPSPRLPPPK